MAATQVFAMENNYGQGSGSQGICTAASLYWAKKCLDKNASVESKSELVNDHTLNAAMAVIRKKDSDPRLQCDLADLVYIADIYPNSIGGVISSAKSRSPHIAIFWNSFHTMAYRYHHHDKEFFDQNLGLYRAKLTKDIKETMEDVFRQQGYGAILGGMIVDRK